MSEQQRPEEDFAEQDSVESDDAQLVCDALRQVFDENNVSSYYIEDMTGISSATLRRMTMRQEPKPSQIARLERAIGIPLGTIYRRAGLIHEEESIEYRLATDPKLHPMLRKAGATNYRSWVELSSEGSRHSIT